MRFDSTFNYLAQLQTNGPLCSRSIYHLSALHDHDLVACDESPGCGACGFHQALPVSSLLLAADQLGRFAGADRFVSPPLAQQLEDGIFQGSIGFGGLVSAACV